MSQRSQQQLLQSYMIPRVLAIVILAVSAAAKSSLHVANLLEACGLCAVVIVGLIYRCSDQQLLIGGGEI